MACQGCGRVSKNQLCCPTCIELGRTSFFCGQECFTKYWATHNAFHETLRKKRAQADEDGSAGAGAAVAELPRSAGSEGGGSSSSVSRPSTASQDSSSTYSRMAPLAGGTPLMGSFASAQKRAAAQNAAAVKKSDDGAVANAAPGVLGFVGSAVQAMLSGPPSGSGPANNLASALKSRLGASTAEQASRQAALRARSPGPAKGRGPEAKAPSRPRPAASLQTALWVLVAVTISVGGIFWWQQRKLLAQEEGLQRSGSGGQAAFSAAAAAAVLSEVDVSVAGAASGARADVGAPRVVTSEGGSGVPVSGVASAVSDAGVGNLRAELATLKELVERHDKMLRYVMDRYVEKDQTASTGGAKPADAKNKVANEALPEVHAEDPKLASSGEADAKEARGGGSQFRKRKGGGESMVGMPHPESETVVEGAAP